MSRLRIAGEHIAGEHPPGRGDRSRRHPLEKLYVRDLPLAKLGDESAPHEIETERGRQPCQISRPPRAALAPALPRAAQPRAIERDMSGDARRGRGCARTAPSYTFAAVGRSDRR